RALPREPLTSARSARSLVDRRPVGVVEAVLVHARHLVRRGVDEASVAQVEPDLADALLVVAEEDEVAGLELLATDGVGVRVRELLVVVARELEAVRVIDAAHEAGAVDAGAGQ